VTGGHQPRHAGKLNRLEVVLPIAVALYLALVAWIVAVSA